MALDTKLFAPVARATNAMYMYVKADETATAVQAAGYFTNKNLSGSVKVGDLIFYNVGNGAASKFGVLKVDVVDAKVGTITTSVAFAQT